MKDLNDKKYAASARITPENTVIFSCSSLAYPAMKAQEKMGTEFPVVYLPRELHADPSKMRECILAKLAELPDSVETVLVAMGFCGGSWRDIRSSRRIVMAYVDDCVTLLLTNDGERRFDRKVPGHIYYNVKDPEALSIEKIFYRIAEARDLPEDLRERYKKDWQDLYESVDIVETGLWDARSPKYVETARRDAVFLDAELHFVPGSNRLLEKLVAGDWDGQFEIMEPGETFPEGEAQWT